MLSKTQKLKTVLLLPTLVALGITLEGCATLTPTQSKFCDSRIGNGTSVNDVAVCGQRKLGREELYTSNGQTESQITTPLTTGQRGQCNDEKVTETISLLIRNDELLSNVTETLSAKLDLVASGLEKERRRTYAWSHFCAFSVGATAVLLLMGIP